MASHQPKLPYVRQRSHSTSSISRRQHEDVAVPQREWKPIVTSTNTCTQGFTSLGPNLGPRVDIQRADYENLPRKNSDSTPDLLLAEYIHSRLYLELPLYQASRDIHSLLGVSPALSPHHQQSSAFSDSSSNYSQTSLGSDGFESRPTSWMTDYRRSLVRMEGEAIEDGLPARSLFRPSSNRSSFQPLRSPQPPSSPRRLASESVRLPGRPPGPVSSFSSEVTSLPEILNISKEDHDRIVRRYGNKPLPESPKSPKAPKHHRNLTIRASDSEGRGKVHWSSSIPRRTSSLISEAKESFSRGIDEISSPISSRFSGVFQSPKWNSSENVISTPRELNTPLHPYPDISPATQNIFFPQDPPTPLITPHPDSPQNPLSAISEASPHRATHSNTPRRPFNSSKKFGWNARHPLKSPHPSQSFRSSKHQQYSQTHTSSFQDSSSHSPGGKFKDLTSTIKNMGSNKGRHAHHRPQSFPEGTIPPPCAKHPFSSTPSTPSHRPLPHSDSLPHTPSLLATQTGTPKSPSPSSTPLSTITTQFRDLLSLKTKEERKAEEDKRIEKQREEFRREILRKGVTVIGPLVQNPGTQHLGLLGRVSPPEFHGVGRGEI
ncbi:hypothetical protein BJ875DRAFT_492371 [Amylocarpus encephaloides]|uniref:Uncharacterized protein n=1 Tax=Amylocarpus encephaloides TaxID=45428 RepID=A0A9P7YRX9_9HELO|nr:hypothetical protein BJ875DRAFT_492371 [Amylocarpus encephaloides]